MNANTARRFLERLTSTIADATPTRQTAIPVCIGGTSFTLIKATGMMVI
jgi:hypothetical protein